MEILYISFGLLEGRTEYFEQQAVTPDVRVFAENLLKYTLENKKTRRCHFRDAESGTAAAILSFSREVLKGEQADAEKIKEFNRSIAGALAEAEKTAGAKIAAMHSEVKKGSLVLALVRDEAQGLCAILAKVDHSKWFNGEDLTIEIGFPFDDKDIWKTALVRISEEGGLAFGDISVYMDREVVYWIDGFLGLVKERTDEDNTALACQRIGKTMSNMLDETGALALWNIFMHKINNTDEMNYPEFVDELVGNADSVAPGLKELREELLALPEKFGFDTQFTVIRKALPKSQATQVLKVNRCVSLTLFPGDYKLSDYIVSHEEPGGDRYLIVKCTEEKTFKSFERKKNG